MHKSDNAIDASHERKLAEFLVDSDLEELSAKLGEFNILQVLRIERAEIRHSNVLAWLLNPRESHGLSDAFVRRFISTLLLDNEQADLGLSSAAVELMDLVDVEVRREWRNIDLLIYSKENRLVVFVENKLLSRESKGQLLKYKEIVQQGFPHAKTVIPVLLTLEGDEPSEIAKGLGYIPWSHAVLYRVSTEVIEQQQKRIPQDAQIFLRHYMNILRRESMQDKELEDLCKSIYRKHKTAIDLIVQYGATTAFGEAAEAFIKEHLELEQVESTARDLWFIPKEWARVMPKAIEKWRSPYPVSLWFVQYQHVQKVGIILEIGPLPDTKQRRKLVEAFDKAGFKTTIKSHREDAKYTRVYSRFHVVNDLGDASEVRQVIAQLWQQSKDKVAEARKVISDFKW